MQTPFPSSAGVIRTAKTFLYTEFIQATEILPTKNHQIRFENFEAFVTI